MDKISVIIPIYNSIKYLNRCLDSVINQTYENLEIILIDDGSIDGSSLICDEYAKKDLRIKVIHQSNRGVSESRNEGLHIATGNYITFIDNDDFVHPKFFELLYKAIDKGKYDMASCEYVSIWESKVVNYIFPAVNNHYTILSKENWFEGLLGIPIDKYRYSSVPYEMVWGKLYKRDLLEGLYFKNLWGEDAEFNSRIYTRICKSILLNTSLYVWVQNNNSAHRSDPFNSFLSFLECTYNIYENIPSNYNIIKAQALKRAWLGILSTRYIVLRVSRYKNTKKTILYELKKNAFLLLKKLKKNQEISILFKTFIIIFYYLPFTYTLFRWGAAKYKNLKN